MTYVGRLAPSPTGLLHLGHAATFLAAGDRAHANGGSLLLRIDDLDPQRSKQDFVDAAKDDLLWLGLRWDAEFRQSERLALYRTAMESLLRQDLVYVCTCSRKDLQGAVQAPHEDSDDEPVYSGRCRPDARLEAPDRTSRSEGDIVSGASTVHPNANYRFRVPDGFAVRFRDEHCGPQSFTAGVDFGDFLVWRKDGLPSYQLASVVDDADMGITEVVRGRDLLKSTARQILLQRALALRQPVYFHTDLLCDAGGQRLAKRHDALSLHALRASGVAATEIRARVEHLLHHTEV